MIIIKNHQQELTGTGFNNLVSNSSIDEKNTILNLIDKKQRSQKERGELLQDMLRFMIF